MKRGDMDSSLMNPDKDIDVHMDARGLNFSCSTCHTTTAHEIDGRHYDTPSPGKPELALPKDEGHRVRCESCHGIRPHKNKEKIFDLVLMKLNDHTKRIACQTCHIPFYAKKIPTNTYWDWSTAGRFKNGKFVVKKGPLGRPIYHTKKGTLKWGKNLIPEYHWYNGTMSYVLAGDPIDPSKAPIALIKPVGSPKDPNSRIFPFKPHRGRQPYDPIHKILIVPKLFGKKGSGAFWAEFDWKKAAAAGMKEAGLAFSGEVGFIDTLYYSPLSHMVSPKEKSLRCEDCHIRNGGRLKSIAGVYIPGRNYFGGLDRICFVLVILTLIGVLGHGLIRLVFGIVRAIKRK